ncbi:MAG: hypothetical protein NVSMB4_18290 [Acidimicrobiales bacterium]
MLFVAYQAFEFVRSLVSAQSGVARRNTLQVVHLERFAHVFWEHRLNAFVGDHPSLAQAMDIYYGVAHFVVPPLVLVWLWRHHPGSFRRWRNTLIVVSLVGLAIFSLYPVAPPRLTVGFGHFIDTSVRFGGLGPLDRGNFVDKNPFAAMPSLHFGWSMWCATAVICVGTRPAKALMVLHPTMTLLVIVGTGNHWLLDAGAAALILAVVVVALPFRHPARTVGEAPRWTSPESPARDKDGRRC